MPDLKRTTFDFDHYHIIYIRDDGTGITSPGDNGHIHDVQLSVSETGEPLFSVLESDNHSHNVIDIIPDIEEDPVVKGSDEELVNEVRVLHRQSKGIERDFRDR